MAFSDPQVVTIATVASTLPRISSGVNTGAFSKDDGTVKFSVAHSYGKTRTRRQARIDLSKIAPDPLISAQNIRHSMSAYIVVDVPPTGFTVAEAKSVVDALNKWMSDATGANITKLLGGEN